MSHPSRALQYAIWQLLPAEAPGVAYTHITKTLAARNIHRGPTVIRAAVRVLVRDGHACDNASKGSYGARGPVSNTMALFWRGPVAMTEVPLPLRPLGTVNCNNKAAVPKPNNLGSHHFISAIASRPPALSKLSKQGPPPGAVPTDPVIIRAWAKHNGLTFKSWHDLPTVNEARARMNRMPFARPVTADAPT